ncbi:MAG: DNA repair protein RadC [Planctomycetes bacterium]|nr:DNA repair protein RadC [Planctomycetota bacterium]
MGDLDAEPLADPSPPLECAWDPPSPALLAKTARARAPSKVGDTSTGGLVRRLLGGAGGAADWDACLIEASCASASELAARYGLPRRAAERLEASFALARQLSRARLPERPAIRGPDSVFRLLAAEVRGQQRETFWVLALDGRHRVKQREIVSVGSLTTSIVHPREVFRPAICAAAAAVVCAHNHPSGDPEPSAEDLAVTRRLEQAGALLGIPLLDHVVLGDERFVSLRERVGW